MSAPTIAAIMAGIETRLATISGLHVNDVKADSIITPAAIVGIPTIPDYRLTMARGHFMVEPTVTVLVSASIDRIGQLALAAYANPTGAFSVIAAIEGDKTLGGVAEDCIVLDFRPLGLTEVGTVGYYGGVFNLKVAAVGS